MAPSSLISPYDAPINGTLSSTAQNVLPYTHGLTGVDLPLNDITTYENAHASFYSTNSSLDEGSGHQSPS